MAKPSDDEIRGQLTFSQPADDWDAQLNLPDWYYTFSGKISIKTPEASVKLLPKMSHETIPFYPGWPADHYRTDYPEWYEDEYGHEYTGPQNRDHCRDLISFKPYGESRRWYRVELLSDS